MAASDNAIMECHKPLNYKADIDTSMHKRSYKLELKKRGLWHSYIFLGTLFLGQKSQREFGLGLVIVENL